MTTKSKSPEQKDKKKQVNPDLIELSRKEKVLIQKYIPDLLRICGLEYKGDDTIRLIKLCAFDGEIMSLSFKLNDKKIQWAVSLKERNFGDDKKQYGLTESVLVLLSDIYKTTESEVETVKEITVL